VAGETIAYAIASLAFVGILYLLADAQCQLRMGSERDYRDWVALPDEAKRRTAKASPGEGADQAARRIRTGQDSHFHDGSATNL
jgi:hypothetical protein